MGRLVGMDEAGYGPNLGPLVVAATAWDTPGDPATLDLFAAFDTVLGTPPVERARRQLSKEFFKLVWGLIFKKLW